MHGILSLIGRSYKSARKLEIKLYHMIHTEGVVFLVEKLLGGISMRIIFLIIQILLCMGDMYAAPESIWVDFTTAMSSNKFYTPNTLQSDSQWTLVKRAYDQFVSCAQLIHATGGAANVKIPKIIHQIWLGSPFPEKYKKFQDSWKKNHPDWEYHLWTDQDIDAFGLENRALYDATSNYGEKSDIARYEILYRYGGLYIDTDFECVRAFNELHGICDFYAGCAQTPEVICLIGLIGSVPGHPILLDCIKHIKRNPGATDAAQEILFRTGPQYFTPWLLRTLMGSQDQDEDQSTIVMFPCDFFYPWPWYERDNISDVAYWIKPCSFAIHHWHVSWNNGETP